MIKTVKPITLSKKDILNITIRTRNYLKDTLYSVLVDIINNQLGFKVKLNSLEDDLISQLNNNNLFVVDNFIYSKKGFFSSNQVKILEKLGGEYNKLKKAFYFKTLPQYLVDFLARQKNKIVVATNDINQFLVNYQENIDNSINLFDINFTNTINNYNSQLSINFKKLGIIPELDLFQWNYLNEKYTTDFKKGIKNLANNQVEKLRNQILDFVLNKGYRTEKIAEILQNSYDLTQNKALFLARQESSFLLANFQENRYKELGFNKYVWQTANDSLVRNYPENNNTGENHKRLNEKTFEFDNPPIVNEITGEKANPGERYNCRCLARPVIE